MNEELKSLLSEVELEIDGKTVVAKLALERTCEYCNGYPHGSCTNCGERGTVPTEFGQAIINLIAAHLVESKLATDS